MEKNSPRAKEFTFEDCISDLIQIGTTFAALYTITHAATHAIVHPESSNCLLNMLEEGIKKQEQENFDKLTEREKELVLYFKNGNTTYKELSEKMYITPRSVKKIVKEINQKLSECEFGTGLKALKITLKKLTWVSK